MKTSFKTIRISLFAIFIICCFALAQESSGGTSEPVFPERPVRNEMESDAAYRHRLTRWEAEIRHLTAEANTEQSLPERPEKRVGESDAAFMNRTLQWEAAIRSLTTTTTPSTTNTVRRRADGTTNLPSQPVKKEGESYASFRNRLIQWEAEVRRIMENANSGTSTGNSEIPKRPVRREGESTSSFQNRVSAWEAEIKLITNYQKQNNNELDKLRQELARLSEQVTSSIKTGSYNNAKPESISVIPMGEIETEKLLTINEDLKIMSQILKNELNQQSKSVEWIFKDGKWLPINPKTGTTPINANILNNMYLEGYGALFEMNVNFPLSVPYKELQSEEFQKEKNDDSVWERTKQQILEPQSSSNPYSRAVHEKPEILYDSEDVEKIKTSIIKSLKYASNIRALQQNESVILRISEFDTFNNSIKAIMESKTDATNNSIKAILDNKYFIETEAGAIWVSKENLSDYIELLPQITLIIRAKKSDIDAFARDELDFDEFREKVQVFSYPLISGN